MAVPLLKDSNQKSSVTMTAFVVGFIIVNLKLMLSGVVIKGFTFEVFTGYNYALALSALGGIYVFRRNTGLKTNAKVGSLQNEEKV